MSKTQFILRQASALGTFAILGGSIAFAQSVQPRSGDPIQGLSAAQLTRFTNGKTVFEHTLLVTEGLGPIFNDTSCVHCHLNPSGGSSAKFVTRFGQAANGPNPFDPLANLGGSLLQAQSINSPTCDEVIPPQANVTTHRITPPTMGFGLVEAIPDGDIQANAINPPPGVHGIVSPVNPLEDPTHVHVGRFGWKAQQATLLSFSADASLNEMGLTNMFLQTENAPNGNLALLAQCDSVPDPEDHPDGGGVDMIHHQTDFQMFLAPPPQTPKSGMTGEALFVSIGCASCHIDTPFMSGPGAEPGLANQPVKAYSDFLLHDMAGFGDGIVQGAGTERLIRTPPLWGMHMRGTIALMHNGSVAGGTFQQDIDAAVADHDIPAARAPINPESHASAVAYNALTSAQRAQIGNFLDSLGKAEFDWDGNNSIDEFDWFFLQPLFTGPGAFFTPDDPVAVADFDQDGDFDLIDFGWMQRAFTGS
jgi:CxxC motif-containing protein (DUF1111 family)